jgi:ABC-2 type transporter
MADTLAHVRKTANVLNKLPKSYGIVRVRSDFSRNLAMGDVQVQVLVHGAFNAGRDHAVYLDPPVAQLWFRIPFAGSFVTLYAAIALFVLAAVGIGLLVSSVVANMQQGMLFSFVILMPFTLLSGLTTPIENMPKILQYFTMVNPLRYAIDIIHRIYLEGVGLGTLFPELWPLAVIGAVTLAAASWMFRNRLA